MSRKGKTRVALGSLLTLVLAATCVAVYQSGSKSTPNEKEFVQESQEDSVDQAIRTEEREEEEETQDANTSNVEGEREIETESSQEDTSDTENTQDSQTEETAAAEETAPETADNQQENQETVSAEATAPDMNFTESSLMEWPVNGQVVIDYDMEHTVYFPTLNVYKLNPAIVISSEVNAPVAAVANGKIVSVLENEETGTTVTVDMGNGYQAVYGQLKDVAFSPEQYVTAGSVLGYVNEPTKYYSTEGANLYFALQKDGSPLDPLQYLP